MPLSSQKNEMLGLWSYEIISRISWENVVVAYHYQVVYEGEREREMDVVRQDISRYAAIKLLIPLKSDTPRVYWRSVKRLDWVSRPNM